MKQEIDLSFDSFLLFIIRCGPPERKDTSLTLPTWGGSYALLSNAVVPLMHVVFIV